MCLAGTGSCPDSPLATLPEFEWTLARLPDEAPIHGFLNLPQLREMLVGTVGSELPSLLDSTDGIAFARTLTVDGIETWVTGRFVTTMEDDSLTRLLATLAPIGRPLSEYLPDSALAAYDLGASPVEVIEFLAQHLETTLPVVHAWLRGMVDEFRMATGLDPERDLLPSLGRGIAVGVLPPEDDLQGWPLPRPVLLMTSTDDAAVRRFMDERMSWAAGALAPMTQGLLGARVVSGWAAGTELVGLQLDSVFTLPMPLPSPTVAVADGLVILSPVRSGVVEILQHRPSNAAPVTAAVRRTAAVETIWLNLPAWPDAWRRAEILFSSPHLEQIVMPGPVIDIARSVMGLLGGFGPATAAATVTSDGEFTFHLAIPRNRETTENSR
jgi:hypothetical protein